MLSSIEIKRVQQNMKHVICPSCRNYNNCKHKEVFYEKDIYCKFSAEEYLYNCRPRIETKKDVKQKAIDIISKHIVECADELKKLGY